MRTLDALQGAREAHGGDKDATEVRYEFKRAEVALLEGSGRVLRWIAADQKVPIKARRITTTAESAADGQRLR